MRTLDPDAIGQHIRLDGTLEAVSKGDRWIMRIDPQNDTLEIDPDVAIEGWPDPSEGFRLTASFTTAEIHIGRTAQITCHDQNLVVDQHALLNHAYRTGERRLRLSSFPAPASQN